MLVLVRRSLNVSFVRREIKGTQIQSVWGDDSPSLTNIKWNECKIHNIKRRVWYKVLQLLTQTSGMLWTCDSSSRLFVFLSSMFDLIQTGRINDSLIETNQWNLSVCVKTPSEAVKSADDGTTHFTKIRCRSAHAQSVSAEVSCFTPESHKSKAVDLWPLTPPVSTQPGFSLISNLFITRSDAAIHGWFQSELEASQGKVFMLVFCGDFKPSSFSFGPSEPKQNMFYRKNIHNMGKLGKHFLLVIGRTNDQLWNVCIFWTCKKQKVLFFPLIRIDSFERGPKPECYYFFYFFFFTSEHNLCHNSDAHVTLLWDLWIKCLQRGNKLT